MPKVTVFFDDGLVTLPYDYPPALNAEERSVYTDGVAAGVVLMLKFMDS